MCLMNFYRNLKEIFRPHLVRHWSINTKLVSGLVRKLFRGVSVRSVLQDIRIGCSWVRRISSLGGDRGKEVSVTRLSGLLLFAETHGCRRIMWTTPVYTKSSYYLPFRSLENKLVLRLWIPYVRTSSGLSELLTRPESLYWKGNSFPGTFDYLRFVVDTKPDPPNSPSLGPNTRCHGEGLKQ